jgi:predicted porin
MKTSQFAPALLLAFAGAASAQSVTLFGVVDLNLRWQSNDGTRSKKVMGSDGLNSSRLGFRGVEDLGDGWKAAFWLEAAMTPNEGTSAGLNFKRRSTMSLISSQYGEVRLGRDYTPSFWARASYDPFGFNGVGLAGNVDPNGILQPTYVRSSNAVQYFLPSRLGGAYGQFMVAAGEGGSNTKYEGGRLGWANDKLDVSASVARQALNFGANSFKTWVVGGSYKFSFTTLEGVYNHDHVDTGAGTTYQHWLVGTVVPFGQSEIHASYNDMGAGHGNGAKMVALGYVYNLSKRTALYSTYSSVKNEGAFKQSVDFSYSPVIGGGTPVTVGGRSSALESGIRHAF